MSVTKNNLQVTLRNGMSHGPTSERSGTFPHEPNTNYALGSFIHTVHYLHFR